VPLGTDDPSVSNTCEPTIDIAVGVTEFSPTNTVNALKDGVGVAVNDSLNVSVTLVPLAATVDKVGGAMSGPAVELLLTDEYPDSNAASLPAVSWIAELVVQLSGVGAV
jgi:hypothetical protein